MAGSERLIQNEREINRRRRWLSSLRSNTLPKAILLSFYLFWPLALSPSCCSVHGCWIALKGEREATMAPGGLTTTQLVPVVFFILLVVCLGAAFMQDMLFERTLRGH